MQCCFEGVGDEARQYIHELTAALATLDLDRVKDLYGKWATAMELPPMPDDEQLQIDMRIMILELPGLGHLHDAAQKWLLARGLTVNIYRDDQRISDPSETSEGKSRTSTGRRDGQTPGY